jgi:hypothetical protein
MTPILALTSMIAMALVIFRAWTQAITIDEATTYVLFVRVDDPMQWLGSSNNHVLNTALMRLTTRIFGVSEISARLPVLLGAGLYISACYRFCRRIGGGMLLQWAALVCLVYSPFIMDYLVAARGYGLALGFLMTALMSDPKKLSGCLIASASIGLCFASNFSFAFACAAVLSGLFVWSWRESGIGRGKLVAAYVLPALAVTWLIAAPAMFSLPRAELWYGSHSLREAFGSLLESQLSHGNPLLYVVPGLISLAWLAHVRKRLPAMTVLFGGAFLATLALHFTAFHLFGLLYPWDRTGIFFVPLLFGAISAAAAVPGGWLRWAQVGAMLYVAVINLANLRLDQFEEWNFNADTDKVYSILTCLHERQQVDRVAAGWPYIGALNFYRDTSHGGAIAPVADEEAKPQDVEVFVIGFRVNPTVISKRQLTVVWKSPKTEATIAVPPEQVERLRGSACFD